VFKRILKIEKPVLNDHWRLLITGVTSIHGWPIYKYVRTLLRPENLFAIRPPKMDIPDNENVLSLCMTDTAGLEKIKETFNPTHIIICSGVCDLDVCEERPDWAYALNVIGAGNIISVFEEPTYIMYMSSDLVFSGNNPPSQGYTEEDAPNPVSVAGKTILGAEQEILKAQKNCIIRLGLPVGDSITGTKGGADWVEGRFRKNRPVTLFHDEFRSCIACDEIADIVTCLFSQEIQ